MVVMAMASVHVLVILTLLILLTVVSSALYEVDVPAVAVIAVVVAAFVLLMLLWLLSYPCFCGHLLTLHTNRSIFHMTYFISSLYLSGPVLQEALLSPIQCHRVITKTPQPSHPQHPTHPNNLQEV